MQGVRQVSDLLVPLQVHKAVCCSPVDRVCRRGQDRLEEWLVARVRSSQRCLQRWSACGRSWVATDFAISAHKTVSPPNAQKASLNDRLLSVGQSRAQPLFSQETAWGSHCLSRQSCQVGLSEWYAAVPHRPLAETSKKIQLQGSCCEPAVVKSCCYHTGAPLKNS